MYKDRVELSDRVFKTLHRAPARISVKLALWVRSVEREGLDVAQRRPGYHDEPLKGQRKGQRSLRLSRSYRAIYVEFAGTNVHVVRVLEVTKHAY